MMTVQVRRRSREKQRLHRVAKRGTHGRGGHCGLIEAYSESCFERNPRFFVASPEHPMLGKWTQRSTLKTQYHPADEKSFAVQRSSTVCSTLSLSSSYCSHFGVGGRRTASAPTSVFRGLRRSGKDILIPSSSGATNKECLRRCKYSESSARRRDEPHRMRLREDTEPLAECPHETPKFGGPRVYAPVSGRVVSVHPQSCHNTAVPLVASTLLLCGSFREQNDQPSSLNEESTHVIERSPRVSSGDTHNTPVVNRAASPFLEGMAALKNNYNPTAATAKHMKTVVLPRPEFRYRVPFEDASLNLKTNNHHDKGQGGMGDYSNQKYWFDSRQSFFQKTALGSQNNPPLKIKSSPVTKLVLKELERGANAVGKEGQTARREEDGTCSSLGTTASLLPDEAENILGKDKKIEGGDHTQDDPWVLSEIDPFVLALRRALLRDRPADLSAYVAEFAADWCQNRNRMENSVLKQGK